LAGNHGLHAGLPAAQRSPNSPLVSSSPSGCGLPDHHHGAVPLLVPPSSGAALGGEPQPNPTNRQSQRSAGRNTPPRLTFLTRSRGQVTAGCIQVRHRVPEHVSAGSRYRRCASAAPVTTPRPQKKSMHCTGAYDSPGPAPAVTQIGHRIGCAASLMASILLASLLVPSWPHRRGHLAG